MAIIPYVPPPKISRPPGSDAQITDAGTPLVARPPLARPTADRPPLSDRARTVLADAMRSFETAVGGRKQAVEVMAIADLDPRVDPQTVEYVVGLLADPANADRSLAAVARTAGIDLTDLLRIYRHALVARAHLLALQQITTQLPAVVADVMRKAAPYEDACGACQGIGTRTADPTSEAPNPSPVRCSTCQGLGRLVYQPTEGTQKLALQLAGLLKSGTGITVVNQAASQHTTVFAGGSGAAGDLFLKVQQAADEILFGTRTAPDPVIEVVPVSPAVEASTDEPLPQ